MTEIGQCRASAFPQPSWIISVTWGGSQNTRSPVHSESFLLVRRDDEFARQIELLRVLRAQREREAHPGLWSPRSHWQLPFSWPAPRTSRVLCGASGARNNSRVKSHFRTEQSYLCPARFQMRCKNKVWTDGRICLFHVPLVNLMSSFARGMFVFHTWTFFPRYKIQYLKVGSGKVDQVILRLIPQMCLFIHVWNTFFPQITGHIKS